MNDTYIMIGSVIGGFSTLMIAILTIAYVRTTSKQLRVMSAQLDEMKQNRYQISQPLVIVDINSAKMIAPRFCYNHVKKDYSWSSQLELKYSLTNRSNYGAVNIQMLPFFEFVTDNEEILIKKSEINIGFLESEKTYESNIIFSDDNGALIKSLYQSPSVNTSPKLKLKILYKNILGAYFLCEHSFNIFIEWRGSDKNWERAHNIYPVLENWYNRINNFPSQFENELKHIRTLTPHVSDDWQDYFSKIQVRFKNQDDVMITINTLKIPSSFKVKVVEDNMVENDFKGKTTI